MTTNLSSLIERIEKSEGESALLDCGIFAAVSPKNFATPEDRTLYARLDWTRNRADWIWLKDIGMKNYTASIDAAMTLVPEGFSFEVRRSGSGDKGQATVWDPMRAPGAREWRVKGCATPALALCAATLRARMEVPNA